MTVLKLCHIPWSRSMRILWLLEEIGCDYELEIDKEDGSLNNALSPIFHVPALQDGDVMLHETGAMTEWICETRAPHLWRAPGSEGRVGWLDWMHFGETLAVSIAAAQCQKIQKTKSPSTSDKMARLEQTLNLLEDWLDDSQWLLSNFSGADTHVGYSVWIASQVIGLDRHPILKAYVARCCARDAFQRAQLMTD